MTDILLKLKMAFNHGFVLSFDSDKQDTATIPCGQCQTDGISTVSNAFCMSCFDFLCRKCKIKHVQTYINHSVSTDLTKCGDFLQLTKKISAAKQDLIQTQNEAKDNLTIAERYKEKALEVIKEERENINKMLDEQKAKINVEVDELEKEVSDKITEKYTADCNKFQSILDDTESLKKDLEDITPIPNNQQTSLDESEFFTTIADSQQKLATIKPKVRRASACNEVTKYKFEPKWKNHCTGRMTISKLGTILVLDSKKSRAVVENIQDINVRASTEAQTCSIKGMCSMSKHFLVVADSQNKSLKVLKKDNHEIVATVTMPTEPRGVTEVKDNQIAVTLPQSKIIQILQMTKQNNLSKSYSIEVNGICQDIVYNKGKLIVTFAFPNHIQVLNMNGRLIQKIEPSHRVLEGSSYSSIGISPDHNIIYVIDQDQDSVFSMTTDGKIKAIYRDKLLEKPRSLTVDNKGYVYVSGMAMVQKLSPDLTKGVIVLDSSHRIKCMKSLLHSENLLYVGMLVQDKIKSFEITCDF